VLDTLPTLPAVPPDHACIAVGQVLPSGGLISVSLWDVDDPEALKMWLDENLGQDCANEVSEVSRSGMLWCVGGWG
jgi:hypothetical protein